MTRWAFQMNKIPSMIVIVKDRKAYCQYTSLPHPPLFDVSLFFTFHQFLFLFFCFRSFEMQVRVTTFFLTISFASDLYLPRYFECRTTIYNWAWKNVSYSISRPYPTPKSLLCFCICLNFVAQRSLICRKIVNGCEVEWTHPWQSFLDSCLVSIGFWRMSF